MGRAPYFDVPGESRSGRGGMEQRVRRCFGAAADAELGQDVAHVVSGSLHADEEPLGDLGVREPLHDQAEHLLLTAAEHGAVPGAGAALDAEVAEEGCSLVGLGGRPHPIERLQGTPSLGHRDAPVAIDQRPGQRQPGPAGRQRGSALRERTGGRAEAGRGFWITECQQDLAGGEVRLRPMERRAGGERSIGELRGGPLGEGTGHRRRAPRRPVAL